MNCSLKAFNFWPSLAIDVYKWPAQGNCVIFSLFANFDSLQLWLFLHKQLIRAARKEGVIFFHFVFTSFN